MTKRLKDVILLSCIEASISFRLDNTTWHEKHFDCMDCYFWL